MIDLSRRGFLLGLGALIAAPAVVRAASLMPVRGIIMDVPQYHYWLFQREFRVVELAFLRRAKWYDLSIGTTAHEARTS